MPKKLLTMIIYNLTYYLNYIRRFKNVIVQISDCVKFQIHNDSYPLFISF